jgi:hypothetical protein
MIKGLITFFFLYNEYIFSMSPILIVSISLLFLDSASIYLKTNLSIKVFRLKENIYVTEFELCETFDGYVGMAAVLSDSNAIYVTSDSSNVVHVFINSERNFL